VVYTSQPFTFRVEELGFVHSQGFLGDVDNLEDAEASAFHLNPCHSTRHTVNPKKRNSSQNVSLSRIIFSLEPCAWSPVVSRRP
jgi:hypothetical protein